MAFSAQVADRGVRVNAVMPGLVESRDFGWTPEEWASREREYPLGRGKPRDIGEAIRYLVSQRLGGFRARPCKSTVDIKEVVCSGYSVH